MPTAASDVDARGKASLDRASAIERDLSRSVDGPEPASPQRLRAVVTVDPQINH